MVSQKLANRIINKMKHYPKEKDIVYTFNVTPDYVLYMTHKDSSLFYLSGVFHSYQKIMDTSKSMKKRVQAWQYVKAMIKILRGRGLWKESECRPFRVGEEIQPIKVIVKDTVICPKCNITYKKGELINKHCPLGCGDVYKLLEDLYNGTSDDCLKAGMS